MRLDPAMESILGSPVHALARGVRWIVLFAAIGASAAACTGGGSSSDDGGDDDGGDGDGDDGGEAVGAVSSEETTWLRRDQRCILDKDCLLEALKLRARVETELVREERPHVAVGLERLRLAAAPIESDHQLGPCPLAQRMLAHELLELGDQLGMPAELELRLEAVFEPGEAELAEAGEGRVDRGVERELGERRPPPERESVVERGCGLLGTSGHQRLPPLPDAPLEAVHVEPLGVDLEDIAVQLRYERRIRPRRCEELADLGQVDVQRGADRARPLGAPNPLDQALARDRLVGVQEQEREQGALPAAAERERLTVDPGFERPEEREGEASLPFARRLLRFSLPFACVGEPASGA